MRNFITLTASGETWTAYETASRQPERRWSLQSHQMPTRLKVVAFYAPTLDAAVLKITEGAKP